MLSIHSCQVRRPIFASCFDSMNSQTDNREQSVVIVHTTGIYTRTIKLCSCQDCKSPYVQLLQARLFPATSDRPSTVFTFEVLEELHLQRIECKTASSNFYSLLRRKTNFNAPADLPVCLLKPLSSPILLTFNLGPGERNGAGLTLLSGPEEQVTRWLLGS